MKNFSQKIFIAIDLLLLLVATVCISYIAGFWHNYPVGPEAYNYLGLSKFIVGHFPHFDWSQLWSNGLPVFLWVSGLPYFFLSLVQFFSHSYELAINLIFLLTITIIILSGYLVVYESTKNRFAAFLSALLGLSLPALWGQWALGNLSFFLSTAFMTLSWWLVIRYLHQPHPSKKFYFIVLLAITLSVAGDHAVAIISILSLIFISTWLLGFTRKLYDLIKDLYLPALLLACFTILPSLASRIFPSLFGQHLVVEQTSYPSLNFLDFFHPTSPITDSVTWVAANYGSFLPWLVLPLLGLFFLLALSHRETKHLPWHNWKIVKTFFFLNLIFAAYGLISYLGFPSRLYHYFLSPDFSFYFLSLGLPILFGLVYHFAITSKLIRQISFAALTLLILFFIHLYFPFHSVGQKLSPNENYRSVSASVNLDSALNSILPAASDQSLYRLAHDNSFISRWLNYDFPSLAQTANLSTLNSLNDNDRFWFTNAVFAQNDNINETKYLLDWFATKWLAVSAPVANFTKFDSLSDLFNLQYSNQNTDPQQRFNLYEYSAPRPLMEATNAKTVLVVGDETAYRNLLFTLAKQNIGSDQLIPLRGNQLIDLYTIDDLKQFDAIFLNNFTYLEKENAFNLLEQYASAGGHVLIESSGVLSEQDGVIAFLPTPVQKIQPGQFGTTWDLQADSQTSLFADVDLNNFGPAIYGDQKLPWSMLYAEKSDLRPDAVPLLVNHDKVVISELKRDQGLVVFSGLNLFYHYNNYPTTDEGRFVSNLIHYAFGLDSSVNFVSRPGHLLDNQTREVTLDDHDYTGVLLKENYFPNWSASLKNSEKSQSLTIHRAGPGLMYVRLPQNLPAETTIRFAYHRSWLEWGALLISLLSLLWVIFHLFFFAPHPQLHPSTINQSTTVPPLETKPTKTLTKKKITKNKNKHKSITKKYVKKPKSRSKKSK